MALNILLGGINVSYDIDQTGFTGVMATDVALEVFTKMVGGSVVTPTSTGLALCDSAIHNLAGFLVEDMAGNCLENNPAYASKKAAVCMGNAIIKTTQFDNTKSYGIGDSLYAGTGAKAGLVTTDATFSGVAASGDLQSKILVTAANEGVSGNRFTITVASGAGLETPTVAGAETVGRVGDVFTVYIEDTVTTQTQLATAILTQVQFTTAVADSGATAFTLAGDATDSIAFTSGVDGADSLGMVANVVAAGASSDTYLEIHRV